MANGSVDFGQAPLCNRKQDAVAESKSSGLQRPYHRLFHPRDFFTGKPGGLFVCFLISTYPPSWCMETLVLAACSRGE